MVAAHLLLVLPPLAPRKSEGGSGRRDVANGGWGSRLEGDITVVAGKSGGKWEIQRPGDKWLITAGERPTRSARRYYEGDDKGWGEYTAVIGQEREAIWTQNLGRWCTWVQGHGVVAVTSRPFTWSTIDSSRSNSHVQSKWTIDRFNRHVRVQELKLFRQWQSLRYFENIDFLNRKIFRDN